MTLSVAMAFGYRRVKYYMLTLPARSLKYYTLVTPADRQRPQWSQFANLAAGLLLVLALWLWAISLSQIDLHAMDDTGLISVLPPAVLVALALLAVSFSLTVTRRVLLLPLLFAQIVALVLMLYGITALIQEMPRFAISWKLAGIIDYIRNTGIVDGRIDAFFNWPGFFILMAFITETTGLNIMGFMSWAPVIFNLLYMLPLWMLFRAATSDLRLVMLGLWFFYLANWIGQDYLAPQALNLFFFIFVLAILIKWLRGPAWQPEFFLAKVQARTTRFDGIVARFNRVARGNEAPVAPGTPVQRAALVVIVIFTLIVMVPSHQLTPFAALLAITALVFINRCSVLTLPLILALMVATWVLFMASSYMWGHAEQVAAAVGSITTNIDNNLTKRLRGSDGHLLVNYVRIGMSFGVWALAALGTLRRYLNGYRDWSLALPAVTPFGLLLLQSYGGEVLLRVYIFAMPFMVFLGACLFCPVPGAAQSPKAALALTLTSCALLTGFLFSRYGNERMMYFDPGEVEAIRYVYEVAEPGSQLIAITDNLPWRFQDYRTYKYNKKLRVAREHDIPAFVEAMGSKEYPASFLILTRSQQASAELFIGWPPGTWEGFIQAIDASGEFRLIYTNEYAHIYVLESACQAQTKPKPYCVVRNRGTVELSAGALFAQTGD